MPQDTPLPVTSKQEHNGEWACPLSHPNWNGNTTRRVYPLLTVSKWDNATRRGKPPSHHVRIGIETRRGGVYPLLAVSKWDNTNWNGNTTRRGISPPRRVKMGQRDEEGYIPPRHVETGTTRRGGVYPSWSRSNRNESTVRRGRTLLTV